MKKQLFALVLVTVAGAQTPAAAQCSTVSPGSGWVCVNDGWLPPGHPGIPTSTVPLAPVASVTAPSVDGVREPSHENQPAVYPIAPATGPNAAILDAANSGTRLPAGDIYFTPPLRLKDIALLQGTAGRTILRPIGPYTGPLVEVESSTSGDPELWYLRRASIRDIRFVCGDPTQTGMVIRGGVLTFERVEVVGCGVGVRFDWAVNVAFRDSLFTRNTLGMLVNGYGPSGFTGSLSVTTLRISGSRFGQNGTGIQIGHGLGIVLDDSTVIEGNTGVGLKIVPTFPGSPISVMLRDVWMEANGGGNIEDPFYVVHLTGFTGGHE